MNGLVLYDDAVGTLDPTITAYWCKAYRSPDFLKDENPWSRVAAITGLYASWFIFDFGEPVTIVAAGLINHNFYAAGCNEASVWVGTTDNGSTFDVTVQVFDDLNVEDHDPNVAVVLDTPITKRYWRLLVYTGTTWRLGGLFLGQSTYEFGETPDAPFGDSPIHFTGRAHKEGGSRARQKRGGPAADRSLRWICTTEEVSEDLATIAQVQGFRRHPFFYVPHDAPSSTYLIPEYVRLTGFRRRERSPGGLYAVNLGMEVLVRR